MRKTIVAVGIAALGLIAAPQAAFAGSADTDAQACGSTSAGWNAPKGALVASRGDGPVTAVIDGIGEYRTHNMLSHGAGGWVTHSTMHSPGTTGWPTYCSTPVRPDELEHGFPGASQTDQGGIYTFLNGYSYLSYFYPSGADRTTAENIADLAWNDLTFQGLPSTQDNNEGMYTLSHQGNNHYCDYNWHSGGEFLDCPSSWKGTNDGCDCGCQWNDPDCGSGSYERFEYGVYQYMDIENRQLASSSVTNNATQCTSFDADLFYRETGGADHVAPHTYTHDQFVNAGEALYDKVKEECEDGLGFWEGPAGWTCLESSICDDAGRQVRNCFMDADDCDSSSSSPWNNAKNNSSVVPTSLSPDDLLGLMGHDSSGPNIGPWAGVAAISVLWNSGGSVYGCWF